MSQLLARLRSALQAHGRRVAVEGSRRLLSADALAHDSARLARALMAAGLQRGQPLPLLLPRSPAFVLATLAALRCGAYTVPLDGAVPPLRLQGMLDSLGAPLALHTPGHEVTLPSRSGAAPAGPTWTTVEALLEAAPAGHEPWPDLPDDSAAYAMFTSGSTGAPKAVLVPHRAVHRLVCDTDYLDLRPGARWALMSSTAFDASTLELWAPLLNGGTLVLQEQEQPGLDELAAFIADRRVSDAWMTSALFSAMVDDRLDAFGGLRQLLTGGERVSPRHARTCLQAWPALRLVNGYGPTENTTFSLCHPIVPTDLEPDADGRLRELPIGVPIRGTTARVAPAALGADGDGQDAGAGGGAGADIVGELWVGGDGLALGYLGDEGLTAQRFVFDGNERWYRTGDLVRRRPDGVHEFIGRQDRQVKLAGHRIDVEEVEATLQRAPGVLQGAVVVVEGDALSRHLRAFYSGSAAEAAVVDWMAKRLPPAAVPHRLQCLPVLPLTLNGKLDRAALARLPASALPGAGSDDAAGVVAGPVPLRTPTEVALAALWAERLPQLPEGPDADFLRLGGGSLMALRLAGDIARRFARRVDPLDLLVQRRLGDMARLIDAAPPVAVAPAATALPDGQLPLSGSQQALLAAARLDASGTAYLVHVALELAPGLAERRLRQAFSTLAERHPVLRLTLGRDAAASAAVRERPPAAWWVGLHATAQPRPVGEELPAALRPAVQRPLDPAREGVMRMQGWPVEGGGALWVWTVHHAVIDDWSIALVLDELDALLEGRALPAPRSPIPVASIEAAWVDEAAVQRRAVALVAEAQARPPVLPPQPLPQPGGERAIGLDPAIGPALDALADRLGCTLLAPLALACSGALQRSLGGGRHLLTPFARRAEPELAGVVDYLLEMRFIEAGRRDGETTFAALLRLRDALWGAQGPALEPLHLVTERLLTLAPAALPGCSAFALTLRQPAAGRTTLAGRALRRLHVPQQVARFGLVLHAEGSGAGLRLRAEAVQPWLDDGTVDRFAVALREELAQLGALAPLPLPVAAAGEAAEPAEPAEAGGASAASAVGIAGDNPEPGQPPAAAWHATVAAAWARWVGQAPAGDDAHFLRAGGSSLLAMRLAATLREQLGRGLDLPQFLRRPTFGHLCALLQPAAAGLATRSDADGWRIVGPPDAARLVLLLPGRGGGALGQFHLAEQLLRQLPPGHACVLVDANSLMRQRTDAETPEPASPLAWLLTCCERIVEGLGARRWAAVAGYSLGGNLALELLARLGPDFAHRVPVCLLDSYAPRHIGLTSQSRRIVNLVRDPGAAIQRHWQRLGVALGQRKLDEVEQQIGAPDWLVCQSELAAGDPDSSALSVVLVRVPIARSTGGVLRRAHSNGFDPARFRRFTVHQVEGDHGQVVREHAPRVAALIAAALRTQAGNGAVVAGDRTART